MGNVSPVPVLLHCDELAHILDDKLPLLDVLLSNQAPAPSLSLNNLKKGIQQNSEHPWFYEKN
jgi:hypothetical protein